MEEGTTAPKKLSLQSPKVIMAIEESTGQLQMMLGEILSHFDVQAEKLDLLSTKMKNLGQQVEIQQDNLDEVKCTQVEFLRQPLPPPPPLPLHPPHPPSLNLPRGAGQVTTVIPPSAFTNHRPPLLSQPQGVLTSYGVAPRRRPLLKTVGTINHRS